MLTLTGFETLSGLFRPDPIINGYKKTGMLPTVTVYISKNQMDKLFSANNENH
ncbi:hypothetical protein KsCSTR_22000 [Candidatus Kuenenia stuttgartiensis]|uniref:Uncharacterized protein n=1 Tax=Kuenenia stuttgartiensis TaxID=174633 RepID=Q1Q387_KUEST|nr:hypothetical protein KsCSTR_22000 [Candidatus Kuenenia stuttgartiensis]CAJ74480.1 unknown protein [Candidatus Kuenenia stuttgartiensis]